RIRWVIEINLGTRERLNTIATIEQIPSGAVVPEGHRLSQAMLLYVSGEIVEFYVGHHRKHVRAGMRWVLISPNVRSSHVSPRTSSWTRSRSGTVCALNRLA